MKIALFGISQIKLGKHNLKDSRFDQVDKLAEAGKKTYAQVDVLGEDQLLDADAILTSQDNRADLILKGQYGIGIEQLIHTDLSGQPGRSHPERSGIRR